MCKNHIRILLIVLLASFTRNLAADVILLKNGLSVSGQVTGHTRAIVNVSTPTGNKVINKSQIRSIKFGLTKSEVDARKRRQAEIAKRQQQLALARKQKEQAQITAEQKKLQDLKRQEEQNDRELKNREKNVLSVEEELARLNKREGELRQELARIRDRRHELGDDTAPLSSRSILWRSAVYPGWGQLYADEYWIGISLMSAFSVAVLYNYDLYLVRNQARRQYHTQSTMLFFGLSNTIGNIPIVWYIDQLNYKNFDKTTGDLNSSLSITGIIYAANLLHAFFFSGGDRVVAHENLQGSKGRHFQMNAGNFHNGERGVSFSYALNF